MIKICDICNNKFETKSATRIYCYNGQLREIFTDVGNDIPLDGGLYITDMKNLTISEKNKGLLEIEAEYEDIGKRKLIVNIKEEQ